MVQLEQYYQLIKFLRDEGFKDSQTAKSRAWGLRVRSKFYLQIDSSKRLQILQQQAQILAQRESQRKNNKLLIRQGQLEVRNGKSKLLCYWFNESNKQYKIKIFHQLNIMRRHYKECKKLKYFYHHHSNIIDQIYTQTRDNHHFKKKLFRENSLK
ncbi:unnamed protein product [Paramecium octaurelia]|uniref:Uncharacterized protein n=1 Tax=Paramecium octaurelia TaxID=43137 RepID=A0A8S1SB78_PAROT|nr:unnamed protein product [Paramecium octaurelia]